MLARSPRTDVVPVSDFRPVLVTSAMDAAAVLTLARKAKGWTGEELDARAGWPDRYTSKIENPEKAWGKRGLQVSPMWEIGAQTLGLVLVVMTREEADKLGAEAAPARPVLQPVKVGCDAEALALEDRRQDTPCGECHLKAGEVCDICGATQ